MNALTTIVVILVAFTIGYVLIGWFMDRLKGQSSDGSDAWDSQGPGPRDDGHSLTADAGRPGSEREQPRGRAYEDPETRYAKVLGLPNRFTGPEIQARVRTLIALYHADKVKHLAPEVQAIADGKTREILEAYEYFRVKYSLK